MEEQDGLQEPKQNNSKTPAVIGIISLLVIVLVGGVFYEMRPGKKQEATLGAQVTPAGTSQQHAGYKDGTYTVEGDYVVHRVIPEHIKVTLTLKNDIITSSDVTAETTDPISLRLQGVFIDNYKPYVIGKDIASLHVGKIASSSLTPVGFNDALTKIEAQAKA